jgi:YVTN family beta-propeller protein
LSNPTRVDKIALGSSFEPGGIAVNAITNMIYVTNDKSSSVSVIDAQTERIVANITVGLNPFDIAVNPNTNMIYVTNVDSNTVSVINGSQNSLISTIDVGAPPTELTINPNTGIVYVLLPNVNRLSVIDGQTNKLMGGVTFKINPQDSGYVYCNGKKMLDNGYVGYYIGTRITCESKLANNILPFPYNSSLSLFPPGKFGSWSGDIDANQDDPIILNVTHFGRLTANNEVLSEAYLSAIVGAIVVPIGVWIYKNLGKITDWFYQKRQHAYLNRYMKTIESVYHTAYQNKQESLRNLNAIRIQIIQLFGNGSIREDHFERLNKLISDYTNRINSSPPLGTGSEKSSSTTPNK